MSRGEALTGFSVESDSHGERSGRAAIRVRMTGTAGLVGTTGAAGPSDSGAGRQ